MSAGAGSGAPRLLAQATLTIVFWSNIPRGAQDRVLLESGRRPIERRNSAARRQVLPVLDIPRRAVEERTPHGVALVGKPYGYGGVALGFDRFTQEPQAGLARSPPSFSYVATRTGAHHILPIGGAGLGSRDDMIQSQLGCGELPATVLTPMVITGQDTSAIEFHLVTRELRERQNTNNARGSQVDPNRAHPFVILGFEFESQCAELDPVFKVIRYESSIFHADDFGYGFLGLVSFDE